MFKFKFFNTLTIALILFQAVLPIPALAMASASTNQLDYAPGSVVTISGDSSDGFVAGENVHVDVSGPNGSALSCDATADDNGAWSCDVTVPSDDSAAGDYSYTATGETSGTSTSGSFTVTAPPPPTVEPTQEPTQEPTVEPTQEPTQVPTVEPTESPTVEPTATQFPTVEPTASPTVEATSSPTEEPRLDPTDTPTPTPTGPVLTPFITSDKDDYAPGERVTLTSGNWQSGESVHLIINDVIGNSWILNDDVFANGSGGFTYQFNLPNWFVAQYHVYAYGTVSGAATTDFTDAISTTTAVASSTNPSSFGQSVTFTATVTSGATPVTVGQVKFGTGSNCTGQFTELKAAANVNGSGQVTYTTSSLAVGSTTIRACYLGTGGGGTSDSTATVTQIVNKATPTITFGAAPTPTYLGGNFTVSASTTNTDSSALTYSRVSGPCAFVSGATFSSSGAGTCVVQASGAATTNFNAASNTQNVTIGKATPTITWANPADITYNTALSATQLNATASVPGTFLYSPASGTVLNAGNGQTLHVDFTPTDAANYNTASKDVTINVLKASSSTVITCPSNVTYTGSALTPCTATATGAGGLSVSVSVVYGNNTAAGTATADATYAGDSNHNSSTATQKTFTIDKANPVCTVTGYDVTYDAQAHTATGECLGVEGETLAGLDLTGTTHTAAGDYPTDGWTFTDSTGNYNDDTGTVADSIAKADAICTVTGYSVTYNGLSHSATGSCTGVGGTLDVLAGLDLSGTAHTFAGSYTDSWNFTDVTGNYNNQGGTVADVIAKADAVCSVDGYTGVYDGAAHGATGSCTGIAGVNLSAGLNLGDSFTDVPGGTAHWAFTGGDNYNDQSGTAAIVINQADAVCSVLGYTGVYDGVAHGASGSCTGVGGVTLSGLNLGASFTDVPGGTAHWTFSGGTNYNDQSGDAAIVINKADAVCSVLGYTGVYDGVAHGASGSCTGVGGVTLSGLNLGASFTDVPGGTAHWTFAGGTNYNDKSGDAAIVIGKADAVCTVTGYSVTYDGLSHTATGSCLGVEGEDLSADLNLNGTAHIAAGSYTDSWTFTDSTGNYNDDSGTVADSIGKADAVCSISGYAGFYDAAAHGASGSCTGVGGITLGGLNLGASFTDAPGGTAHWTFAGGNNYNDQGGNAAIVINKADAVCAVDGYSVTYDALSHTATGSCLGVEGETLDGLDLSGTTHTAAGTYATDAWTFTDVTGNYNDDSGTVADSIGKADAVCSVDGYSATYDALAHTATGSCSGIGGESAGSLDLGDSFMNVPGGTAHWVFTGNGNYKNQEGDAAITITKADASVLVNGFSGVYDALAHGATLAHATGVGGVDLSSGINLGATFTDVPGGTAHWTFDGGTNYNNQAGDVAIDITKADASVLVNGYSGVYDATAHGASLDHATGVGGVDLSSGIDLGASFTNVPGGTAHWTFDGGTNYNNQSGNVAITITKANATINVLGYTGIYNGAAHGATGTATGVAGVDLSAGLNLGATFTDVPGGTAHWTFNGGTNYNNQSGDAAIVINKANAVITVNGYSGVYDGLGHGASGTAMGVESTPANLNSLLHLGASFTNVPGGTAHWTFDGNGNYNAASGDVNIILSKANAHITVNGYTGVYDANAHGATGSASGVEVIPADLSSLLHLGASFTNVPGGTAHWTFDGNGNYNSASGDANIVLSKANATIVVNGYSGVYDGAAHGATGTATGLGGVNLGAGLNLGASFTNVPGGTAHWTFSGGTNYNDANGDAAITITKANQTIIVTTHAPASAMYGTSFTVAATGGASGNAITYSASGNCTNGGATFTMTSGSGTCTVRYNQAGNGNYNAATEVTESVNATAWTLTGFYQPVDMSGVYNTVKNGSTVPLKFEIFSGGTELTNVSAVLSLTANVISCQSGVVEDVIEVTATGNTSLRYDSTGGQFIYNWKTPSTANKCYRVTMTAQDGSKLEAFFKLK